jgi:hypothetical protein
VSQLLCLPMASCKGSTPCLFARYAAAGLLHNCMLLLVSSFHVSTLCPACLLLMCRSATQPHAAARKHLPSTCPCVVVAPWLLHLMLSLLQRLCYTTPSLKPALPVCHSLHPGLLHGRMLLLATVSYELELCPACLLFDCRPAAQPHAAVPTSPLLFLQLPLPTSLQPRRNRPNFGPQPSRCGSRCGTNIPSRSHSAQAAASSRCSAEQRGLAKFFVASPNAEAQLVTIELRWQGLHAGRGSGVLRGVCVPHR